jgi:hypothetical protein
VTGTAKALALVAVIGVCLDVATLALAVQQWPRAAARSVQRNRAHLAQRRAEEAARCWDVAPEDPTLEACDVSARFLAALETAGDPPLTDALIRAGAAALRCRCVHAPTHLELSSVLLSYEGTGAERARWQAIRIELAARVVDARTLDRLHTISRDPWTRASDDTGLRAARRRARSRLLDPAERHRRARLAVSALALELGGVALGEPSLRDHDEVAALLALSRRPAPTHELEAALASSWLGDDPSHDLAITLAVLGDIPARELGTEHEGR